MKCAFCFLFLTLPSSSLLDRPSGSDTWSSAATLKPDARQHPSEAVCVLGRADLGQDGAKTQSCCTVLSLPQAVTALWPVLLPTAALGSHRFIMSPKCSGCRQWISWRSTGAAAFGSDLGLRKPADRGNSEGLLSSISGHPLSEPRKWDLAKLGRSETV